MSEVKHTPGPWVLEYFGADGIERKDAQTVVASYEGRHGENGEAIAEVFRWAAGNNSPHPEARANADLIAAAPDLLAACKSAANLLHRLGGANHDPEYSELLAAIAAACGY